MNNLEKQIIYSAVLRLANEDEILSPAERRDVISELCHGLCDMSLDEILSHTENNRKLRLKRGDTTANDAYMGLAGEITMDTDTGIIRVHDGETVGGVAMARAMDIAGDWVVESQLPTAENNYTWYRKYKSGWVEMGGEVNLANDTFVTITLPVEMSNTLYHVQKTGIGVSTGTTASYRSYCITNRTTTSFQTFAQQMSTDGFIWHLCGMAK